MFRQFKAKNVVFETMCDSEVYGILRIGGEKVESGFYRTENAESAFKTALFNHFPVSQVIDLFEEAVNGNR